MITRTEYPNVFKDWSYCSITDMNGTLLKSCTTQAEANAFLKEHFSDFFACDVRVEFDGCVGYVFKNE